MKLLRDLGTCLRVCSETPLESEDIDPDDDSDANFRSQTPVLGVMSVQRTFLPSPQECAHSVGCLEVHP